MANRCVNWLWLLDILYCKVLAASNNDHPKFLDYLTNTLTKDFPFKILSQDVSY